MPSPRACAEAVRAEAAATWRAYFKDAAGFDSLKPLSRKGVSDWGATGMMALDSLDTLWLMNLTAEYRQARAAGGRRASAQRFCAWWV